MCIGLNVSLNYEFKLQHIEEFDEIEVLNIYETKNLPHWF